jgi:hypothetical protein
MQEWRDPAIRTQCLMKLSFGRMNPGGEIPIASAAGAPVALPVVFARRSAACPAH